PSQRHARPCAGHPRLASLEREEGVDGRDEPGHDELTSRHILIDFTMAKSTAGPEIERLIQLLARLPGLGPRSARRAALHLIKKREPLMAPLASALQVALDKIVVCSVCGNIDTQNPCTVCTDLRRDASIIVVVADVADLWALERA